MTTRSPHLRDHELLRLLDRDGASDELIRLEAHAEGCTRCGAELRSLGHASTVVRARLQEADGAANARGGDVRPFPGAGAAHRSSPTVWRPAAPTPPGVSIWTRAWLRAAVLLLAFAGALLSVAPVRAHIREWVAGAWAQVAGGRAPALPASAAAPAAPPSALLEFRTVGRELRIDLPGRQAAGALVLRRAPGPVGSLEILPGDAGVVPLASENLLELRNAAETRATYVVRVPAGVERVRLKIGAEAVRVLEAPNEGATLPIDVARR